MYQKEVEYYHHTNKFGTRTFNISTEVSRNYSAADIRPFLKQCECGFLGTGISDFFSICTDIKNHEYEKLTTMFNKMGFKQKVLDILSLQVTVVQVISFI